MVAVIPEAGIPLAAIKRALRVSTFCAGAAIHWRSEVSGDCRPLCHRGGQRQASLLRELRQATSSLCFTTFFDSVVYLCL